MKLNLTGQKFGRLTILEFAYTKEYLTYWKARCDCGNIVIVRGTCVKSGHTTSCGCRKKETAQENCFKPKHGKKGTRIYHIWRDMKDRCLNPNRHGFENYGGRGIRVCETWKNSFESFYEWAMSSGYKDDLTIERKDVNGNYCPENCTWATKQEQSMNKRNTVYITFNGETHNLKEWAEITGIPYPTLRSRWKSKKWTVERMLTQPKRP